MRPGIRPAIFVLSCLCAAPARADTAVLVEKAGTIVALPGGAVVREGQVVDAGGHYRVRAGEHAVFLFRNGNLVRLDCDGSPGARGAGRDRGLWHRILVSFGVAARTDAAGGCVR